jgi:hypothetical protein
MHHPATTCSRWKWSPGKMTGKRTLVTEAALIRELLCNNCEIVCLAQETRPGQVALSRSNLP